MSAAEEVVAEGHEAVEAVPKRAMTLGTGTSLVVLAALLIAPVFVKNFIIFQMTMLLIYGLAVLALNILTGGSGQFSLGQSAFYAVGAYTTAVLMEHFNVNYALTLPIAGVVCFGFGFLFGQPALRLSGVYLALATFALATAMPQLLKLNFLEHWTGGVQGLVVTKPDAPFGLPMSQDMWLYYFTLVVVIAIYIFSVNLLRSRSGRAFMAIRDNEIAASAMGVDVALYKTLAFRRLRRHHRHRRLAWRHCGAVRRARQLHHHARNLAVPRHGRRRRRLAARLDRRRCLHHFRTEHRGGHLQGPLRRGVRRAPVPRHLPRAAWRKASRDPGPATRRSAQEELKRPSRLLF
ncbi:hypothetical protein ACVWXN_007517 [Bradyrhizobium sp. i1.4.4]